MHCDTDFDLPDFYASKTVKARSPKKCCECRGVILPGERYERATGKWHGSIGTFNTCVDCVEAWAVAGCDARLHGGLWEAAAADGDKQIMGMLSAIAEARDVSHAEWLAKRNPGK